MPEFFNPHGLCNKQNINTVYIKEKMYCSLLKK